MYRHLLRACPLQRLPYQTSRPLRVASFAPSLTGLDRPVPRQPGTAAFRKAIQDSVQDTEDQIANLIGPSSLHELDHQSEISATTQTIISEFQPDFEDAGLALSADQIGKLALLFNDETAPHILSQKGISAIVDPATGFSPAQVVTFDSAAAILSPAQLQVFKARTLDVNRLEAIQRGSAPQ